MTLICKLPSVLSVQNALIEVSLKVWKYWELTNLIVKIFEKRSQGTLFKDVQLILLDDWVFLNPFSTHFCLNVVNFTISSLKFKSGVLKVGNEETRLLKITQLPWDGSWNLSVYEDSFILEGKKGRRKWWKQSRTFQREK